MPGARFKGLFDPGHPRSEEGMAAPAEVPLAGSTEGSGRADASGEGAEVVGSMGGTAAGESSLPRVLNLVPLPAGCLLGDRGAGVDTRSSATLTRRSRASLARVCVVGMVHESNCAKWL